MVCLSWLINYVMRLNVLSHFKEPTPMFMTTFWHLQYMTFIGNCPTGPDTEQDNYNLYVFRHTYVLVFYEPQRKVTFMAPLTPEGERVSRSHK